MIASTCYSAPFTAEYQDTPEDNDFWRPAKISLANSGQQLPKMSVEEATREFRNMFRLYDMYVTPSDQQKNRLI